MRTIKTMTFTLLTAALTLSCGSSKNALQPEALNGEWNIITVNGQQTGAEKQAFLGMDLTGKRLYGCAGCNRILGQVEVGDGKAGRISFGNVGSTRMLCANMGTESAVLEALSNVAGYSGTEQELTLTDSKGHALLTLSKRITIAQLAGKWNITSVYGTSVKAGANSGEMPFLSLDAEQKSVHGKGTCNTINGSFTQTDGNDASLRFGNLLTTMMACPDMQTERQILLALDKVRSFTIKDNTHAALLDENGEEALTLEKQQ